MIKALPDIKASGAPATGAVVNPIARVPPGGMEPVVDLNPMTMLWHEGLAWHDGMVTEVT